MEIHQLRYFAAVAETGSFSRAAERCSIAQPSLSQQIIKLEQELGQPLFHRLGRKAVLSDAGQLLLPRARSILAELLDIKQVLPQDDDNSRGTLSVGFIPTIAPFVLSRVVAAFRQAFPHATLTVREDLAAALVRDLVNGKLDVGIMSLPIHNKMIITEELLTESLVVASSRWSDPITRDTIGVKELDAFPFVALNEMHCLGEQVKTFCYQQQVDLRIVCQTAQLSTMQSCVATGLGISLVPQALAISDPCDEIVYRPVRDVVPQRKIVAATHVGKLPSYLTREFTRMVREGYPVPNHLAVPVM